MKEVIRKQKSILLIGITFIACAAVLFAVHTTALTYMATDEIALDMSNDTMVGSRLVYDKLSDLRTLAKHAALELGNAKDFPGYEMFRLLRNFVNDNRFDDVYFISTEGKMYMQNTQEIPLSPDILKYINSLNFSEGAQMYSGLLSDNASCVSIITPVYKEKNRIGYFVGNYTLTSEFFADIDRYIEIDSGIFLIDREGNVMIQSTGNTIGSDFNRLSNLYSFIEGMDVPDGQLERLRSAVGSGLEGFLLLEADGTTYGVSYYPIAGSLGWRMVNIYPENDFMTNLISQRQGETALLIFDVSVIFMVLIGVSLFFAKREKKLSAIAYSDGVTAARTKEYMRHEGRNMLRINERAIPYAVATIDIVGFRYVNELFGHERGDEILKVLADNIIMHLGTKEILARNTADYFELLMANPDDFKKWFAVVSETVQEYAKGIDVTYPLHLRAGYVRARKSTDILELIDKANAARKTVEVDSGIMIAEYSQMMQDKIKLRDDIEASKEAAMEHGEFKVFLQPKFDVMTKKLSGAEALVRWIKRDGTMVFPDQFIPVFETDGFVERIDYYMLEQVCALQSRLKRDGMELVPISVNQSRVLLLNEQYISNIQNIYDKYDIPKSLVELELTETAFFDDKNKMIEILSTLQNMGCVIDIDDFGSGYSSLNMLKDISFDYLKIDRGFFGASDTEKGRIILEKIVDMAHNLGAECVCEGVETEDNEQLLREIGCKYAQGYLYSKPIPAEEFVEKFMTKA